VRPLLVHVSAVGSDADSRQHEAHDRETFLLRHVRLPVGRQVHDPAARAAEAPQGEESHLQRVRLRQHDQDAARPALPKEARQRQEKEGTKDDQHSEVAGKEDARTSVVQIASQSCAV
jgi:hypothetical protein